MLRVQVDLCTSCTRVFISEHDIPQLVPVKGYLLCKFPEGAFSQTLRMGLTLFTV